MEKKLAIGWKTKLIVNILQKRHSQCKGKTEIRKNKMNSCCVSMEMVENWYRSRKVTILDNIMKKFMYFVRL